MQDVDSRTPWPDPVLIVRILLENSIREKEKTMRGIAVIAIVIAALTTVSGTASSSGPTGAVKVVADGNCPGTMVWDGTQCV
jgi:hypothetical protein